MTLDDLNQAVAEATGGTKAGAAKSVQAVLSSIQDALAKKEKVSIAGFGVFETVHRPARDGRNPQTGQTIKIAASNAVKFKPGKSLRDAVND
jgi:DNA-binding protein HU-beta